MIKTASHKIKLDFGKYSNNIKTHLLQISSVEINVLTLKYYWPKIYYSANPIFIFIC